LTLRDALHTAITFDVFNRHADKIAMANVAQTINCIHSLFLAQEDRYARTPVYHVFEMYRGHMGSRRAAMRIRCADLTVPSRNDPATIPGLSGSASAKGKTLTVTITNPSLEAPVAARIRLTAGGISEGRGVALTHDDMTARNTFDRPDEVRPSPMPVRMGANSVEFTLPARSVVSLELRMT